MPLFSGKSKKAFSSNVETEMDAGKPQRQSLAVAYAMQKRKKMAQGGMVEGGQSACTENCVQPCAVHEQESGYDHATPGIPEGDRVDRIMSRRMAKGGIVADKGEDELHELADHKPNEFDLLALDDGPEMHYDAANSGDELDNASEDDDRRDMVARIMRSRSKKDRMPRPA